MAVIDQISTYDGSSWSSPYDIGANAENIALTNTVGRNLGNSNNVSSALQYISGRIIGQNSALAPWVFNSFDTQNNNEKILINNNGVIGLGSSTIDDFVTADKINEINAAIGKTDTDPVTYENLVTNKMKVKSSLLVGKQKQNDEWVEVTNLNQIDSSKQTSIECAYPLLALPVRNYKPVSGGTGNTGDPKWHDWTQMNSNIQIIKLAFVSIVIPGGTSGILLEEREICKILDISAPSLSSSWDACLGFFGMNHTDNSSATFTFRTGTNDTTNIYWQASSALTGSHRINGLLVFSPAIIVQRNRNQIWS